MGSFVGHVDGATMYIAAVIWWMYKAFPQHIKSKQPGRSFRCQLSYTTTICRREVPIEIILKTAFPFFGIVGEIADNHGFKFVGDDGRFRELNHVQHVSIYLMFVLHGVVDLCLHFGVPLPKVSKYLTAIAGFLWYAISFYYHANMEGKEPLETIIHVLATYLMYGVIFSMCAEVWCPKSFTAQLCRITMVLMLGTWFWHTSFAMYIPGFPGNQANPDWDRHDHRNVHFIVACFGFHLAVDITIVLMVYLLTHILMSRKSMAYCCEDGVELMHSKRKYNQQSLDRTVQPYHDGDSTDSDEFIDT